MNYMNEYGLKYLFQNKGAGARNESRIASLAYQLFGCVEGRQRNKLCSHNNKTRGKRWQAPSQEQESKQEMPFSFPRCLIFKYIRSTYLCY